MAQGADILVVDDEQIILDLFSRVLGSRGHKITTAKDGYQAIEEVKKGEFDIIFLDIVMPGINGLETYKKIKEINADGHTIMMTGYSVEELIEQALLEGVQDCLHKPFDIVEIMKTVEKVLEIKKLEGDKK